jgi:AraC-like DNA-binding protein
MLDRRLQLGLDGRRGAAAGLKESGVSASAADFRSTRFRTEELPERERLPFFLDVFGRKVVGQEMEPMAGSPFHVDLVMRSLPGLNVWSGAYSPMSLRRTRTLLADGNDDVALCTAPKGGTTLSHCGRDLTTRDGDAVLISRCDPIVVTRVDQAHHLSISVPRKVLAATVIGLEDALMRPVPADTGALQLLRSYLGVLKDDHTLASPELRQSVVAHVYDLLALTLGATRDAAEIANGRGVRAARLRALKADILDSLGAPALSLVELARRHRVTPRYVQALFEQDGMTFSQFLLNARLARAHRMLRDPLQGGRSISAIAYEAGFGDLSYFNRVFRRHYGVTPSDVRSGSAT